MTEYFEFIVMNDFQRANTMKLMVICSKFPKKGYSVRKSKTRQGGPI